MHREDLSTTTDKDIYSTSVVDIVVHLCFLDDQLISFSPRNCALPDVLRLVSWQPAWLTSVKAISLESLKLLQRQLFKSLKIGKYLHFSVCSGTKTEEGLLERSSKVYKAGKRLLYVKRNKAISLGNVTSKVGIEVHQLSLKDCTWGGQLNVEPVLEVENFTNWKKRKPKGQWTAYERKAASLDQRLKSLIMFVLLDEQMNSFINCLTAKSTWDDMILYHEGPSNVKESRAMDLKFFKISPDDKEDTRSSHEYLNDLEEEYQARALLAKSKRFFKKGTQRFSSAKATDQTECHKCGKKGYFARDCWSKTSVLSYQSPFQLKPLSFSQHKPKLSPTIEGKYNKVKAKLELLSSSALASKASTVKNKGLIAEAYEWDEEEVSSYENEMVEVKVIMALAEDNDAVSKEGARKGDGKQIPTQKKKIIGVDQLTEDPSSSGQKDLVYVKSSADDTKVTIPGVERPWLSEDEGFILPNHDTGRILPVESQRNTTNPSVAVTDSSATNYDSADESSVCSTPLPPLKKLDGAEPISGPKTIKSILRSKSTFKAETLKSVIINEPSLAVAKDNKSSSASKVNSAHAGKLKNVKIKDDPPLAIVIKELNNLKLQFSKSQSSYSRSNQPLQCDIRKPIWYLDNGCSRHMTGVKSYLHKYVEQPGPKVGFGDDSTCTTEGYGSIKCNGIDFIKFDEKRGTIFNSNKEVIMISPRVRDAYVLDMTSSA
ncbi:retrovirus-related pol polyprotein from transposon TNT 1-94 [Tanacetum coccineum]